MYKAPKVSIIMSSYNHEKFIRKCIESVINQTFQDFEFIIFDDCSTDKTYEIAKEYESKKIKIYKSPYNRGMVQNNNEAIKLTKGEYIANLNSDDFWENTKLEKQVKFLDENPNHGAVFTDVNLVDEKDKIMTSKKFKHFENIENKDRFKWLNHWFYHGNCLCYTATMIKKECYDQIGLYNLAFIVLLDLDMWVRICLAGYKIHIIKERLTNFRLLKREKNLGRSKDSQRTLIEEGRVIENYLNIKNKDEFSKIFPNYDLEKLKNNEIKLCLIDLIASDYFIYSNRVIVKKKEYKYLKRLNFLRLSFGMKTLSNYLNENPYGFDNLKKGFNFNFKKYLYFMKYKRISYFKKDLLRVLYICTAVSILVMLSLSALIQFI